MQDSTMNSVPSTALILDFLGISSLSSSMDSLEMIEEYSECYDQLHDDTEGSKRLQIEHCCNPVQH